MNPDIQLLPCCLNIRQVFQYQTSGVVRKRERERVSGERESERGERESVCVGVRGRERERGEREYIFVRLDYTRQLRY